MDSSPGQSQTSLPRFLSSPPKKSPLDARIEEMNAQADTLALNLAAELPCLCLSDGDTLVFLDPPDGEPPRNSKGGPFARPPYRIHSSKILATNSTVLKEMFNPTKQYRTNRRYKCQPLPKDITDDI